MVTPCGGTKTKCTPFQALTMTKARVRVLTWTRILLRIFRRWSTNYIQHSNLLPNNTIIPSKFAIQILGFFILQFVLFHFV